MYKIAVNPSLDGGEIPDLVSPSNLLTYCSKLERNALLIIIPTLRLNISLFQKL